MKEILLNPGVLALVGTFVVSVGAFAKWVFSTKQGLKSTEEAKEAQKERVAIWHHEMYHRLRSACGNHHGWDIVEEFPMFPPEEIIKGNGEAP